MGETRQRVLERASSFNGQKSGLPPYELKAQDSELIKNYILRKGTLQRVNGDETYATISGTGSIKWMDRLANKWILQRGFEIYLESAEDSASFSTVSTLSSQSDILSDQYKGDVYMVNGTDNKFYTSNGSIFNLGLHPPIGTFGSTAAWTRGTGGNLNDDSSYRLTFTFYDPVNNVESRPMNTRPDQYGIASQVTVPSYWTITLAATEDEFYIPYTTILSICNNTFNGTTLRDTSRATKIRFYMGGTSTGSAANVFRLLSNSSGVSEFTIATLAADIHITTEASGVILPTDNVAPPNALRQQEAYAFYATGAYASTGTVPTNINEKVYTSLRFFRDTLFAVGAKGRDPINSTVTTTRPYRNGLYIHEPFQPDYLFDYKEVGEGDGQDSTGVAVLRDSVLVIFKQRSIYYLSGTSVDSYVVRVMDTRRGAFHRKTIQESPFGIFALDRSGVILVNQVGPAQLISNDVEDVIESINFEQMDTCYSGYDAKNNLYYLGVPVEGSTTPNKTLVYNAEEGKWTVLEGQEGASIFFGVSSLGQSRNLIGQSTDGRLARIDVETNVTANGGVINSQYLSGPFYFGDPTKQKKAKFVYILAESNTDWTFDLEIRPDFGQRQSYIVEDLNSESLFSVWALGTDADPDNAGIWDQSLWSGATVRKQIKIPVSSVGYSFQVGITNRSTDEDQYGFRILAIALECSMMGK